MKKNIDVVAIGELLIDFTEYGISEQGNPLMEANPGGAPCNLLSILTKLGNQTAFIGKVGHDHFGKMLIDRVSDLGIDTTYLYTDREVHTTLAFVHTFLDGDRDFSFYRNPGADMMLTEDEISEDLIKQSRIFHFGTLSMTHDGNRNATQKALSIAKENGCLVSFDPNLRPPLWVNLDTAKKQVEYGLQHCDILKISDNELQWFTGNEDFEKGIAILQAQYDIPLILLTMGRDGSRAYYKELRVEVQSFLQENTIETTGAGDTFGGCVLHHILQWGLEDLTEEKIRKMLTFANAGASIITTRKGALSVMPSEDEINHLIKRNSHG
jgi:fructokinase